MSAPLLFLAADPREFAGLLPHWTSIAPKTLAVHWARTAMWRGRPVMAIANGAGADRAFVAVLLAHEISGVCNIGFCGALDPKLQIGDIVVATGVDDGTEVHPAADPRGPAATSGIVATVSRIASTAEEKRALREKGATIVEMEAAGAAKGAQDLGVPFYCVRAVSDLANETFANDFNAALGGDGRFSLFRLVTGALSSPSTRFGELIELQKRTTLASKKLGDFLVNCKF
jgi:uridine phosphorylase